MTKKKSGFANHIKEEELKVHTVESVINDIIKLATRLHKHDLWGDSLLNDVANELEMSIMRRKHLIADWKLYNDSQKEL